MTDSDYRFRRPEGDARPRRSAEAPWSAITRGTGEIWEWLSTRTHSMRRRWVQAVILEGTEELSGDPLKVLYMGSGEHYDYLVGRLFRDEPEVQEHPTIKAWRVRAALARYSQGVDLVVLDLPWPYHLLLDRSGFLESPAWIQQRLTLHESWDQLLAGFGKNTRTGQLRKIRRYRLDYQVTSDHQAAEEFYENMYKRHLQSRFGSSAAYMPRSYVIGSITQGALLQVTRDGSILGAVALYPNGDRLHVVFAGTTGSITDKSHKYVFAALYYFSMVYGFEHGFRELDLTGSRPLLNDGVLSFKRKWGASLHDGWNWGLDTFLIRPHAFSSAVQGFLARNWWIVRRRDQLVGKILLLDPPQDQAALAHLIKTNRCPGLAEMAIYSMDGFPEEVKSATTDHGLSVTLTDLSTSPDPIHAFLTD